MCGLAGYWSATQHPPVIAERMAAALYHRGPDDGGMWCDDRAGLLLIHRRLSILDLSAAGHQPMVSASGRYVIAFNGEIYNHLELRKRLTASHWRGSSDTETLLACIEAWGVTETLQRTIGMFAIALWDREQQHLTLARDRIGEKPLYYGWQGRSFLFASELKALRPHPDFNATVDRNALTLLLRHNYIPAPYSIYQGVSKLTPGCTLTLPLGPKAQPGHLPTPIAYWSLRDTVHRAQQNPFTGSDSEAVARLEQELATVIQRQQLADVPLGAFLSGGIDSSAIVAVMQAHSGQAVNTFTIGMESHSYNEAEYAKAIAAHLGTRHTELYITAQDALGVIPEMAQLYDEPFADSSQIPTLLVARMARQHVTVALSGDGGDELFGGYNRYLWVPRIWRKIGHLPPSLRRLLPALMTLLSARQWDRLNQMTQRLQPSTLQSAQLGDKLYKLAARLDGVTGAEDLYMRLLSEWQHPEELVIGGQEPPTLLTSPQLWPALPGLQERMIYLDSLTYLPDDILTKVDRAAMGVSLETRVPFLDHALLELAWQMPMTMKIRDRQGKWLLRQLLYRHLPKELVERPKMGFAIPLDQWLRGPLREWAEALLDEHLLQQQGYLRAAPIRKRWQEHLSGSHNGYYSLWSVLMFQAWLQQE